MSHLIDKRMLLQFGKVFEPASADPKEIDQTSLFEELDKADGILKQILDLELAVRLDVKPKQPFFTYHKEGILRVVYIMWDTHQLYEWTPAPGQEMFAIDAREMEKTDERFNHSLKP